MKLRVFTLFIALVAANLLFAQDKPAALQPVKLLDGKVEMLMPNDFEPLDSSILNFKYKSQNKPKVVYSNPTMEVNVAVTQKKDEKTGSKLTTALFTEVLAQTLTQTIPGSKLLDKGTVTQNGNELGYIEMKSKDGKSEVYSLVYLSVANEELVMVMFTCPYKLSKTWKSTAKQMMASLKLNKTEPSTNN